ncbi:MAG: hypothetical protein WCP10_02100 [Desulfuromonadales bacterium]
MADNIDTASQLSENVRQSSYSVALVNGLVLRVRKSVNHYFGGYYYVNVLINCDVPLETSFFESENEYVEFSERLGNSVLFEMILDKMAVPEHDIYSVQNELIEKFMATTFKYVSSPRFPRAFVRREADKLMKRSRPRV